VPSKTHHIFLVPGFLGLENLGEVVYFAHVRDQLKAEFYELGLDVEIHAVRNYATASIRKRTLRLLDAILERAGDGDSPLHLIGHSTGGLDARLLCTPGAHLGQDEAVEALAKRVRSIVTIACPHRGTPLASFFTTRFGAQLLSILSLCTIHILQFGRIPISVVVRLAAMFVRVHGRLGVLEHTIANQVFDQLLGDFSAERRDELKHLFTDMAGDVGLMPQLMPEAMDLYDAAVGTRPEIRIASVVACAEPSSLRGVLRLGFDPYSQATHALFIALRRLTSEMHEHYIPLLIPNELAQLRRAFGRELTAADNDGIVPVFSQAWGEIIHVTQADHFDVIGHFPDAKHVPPHYDWLASGSCFDRRAFETLWHQVACFIARGE